jgi:hypothetical protein
MHHTESDAESTKGSARGKGLVRKGLKALWGAGGGLRSLASRKAPKSPILVDEVTRDALEKSRVQRDVDPSSVSPIHTSHNIPRSLTTYSAVHFRLD